jgi:hypothetical protein
MQILIMLDGPIDNVAPITSARRTDHEERVIAKG